VKNNSTLKRIARVAGILFVIFGLIYFVRHPLMRLVGNFLINEDELVRCEAVFMLSGNPESRAKEVVKVYKSGYTKHVVCTGENIPDLFAAFNMKIDEADLSKKKLLDEGMPEQFIETLHLGTSTREESDAILAYCKTKNLKTIMVISDRFHTNRIDYAFRDQFEDAGIKLILHGAPALSYSEDSWWANESGLLMVNNEYVKLFYYYLKY
jgi:hypothetical protein